MRRVEEIRKVVDKILQEQSDPFLKRCGYIHLYGVTLFCTQLAMKRGIDPELPMVAGMLHDIATFRTGDSKDHAVRSSKEARPLLIDVECFKEDEIEQICQAIAVHSRKLEFHSGLAELLKDADVLHNYLDNPGFGFNPKNKNRLTKAMAELGLGKPENDL